MALNRQKAKGRRESGHFAAIPHALIQSGNFQRMSGNAVKLLVQMIEQLRFQKGGGTKNNGDLCVSWSVMRERGWRSKDTLQRARNELLYYGFIEQTRMGLAMVRGRPHLYALTFLAIDECGGKLDVAATRVPSGKWKIERALYKPPLESSE
ncbi:hypothetical protein [Endozoicomonas sp.]|uniref:hypothetical protein n=1 Tax=Endozoicomonas sp. TaxID=1892382 RepID=UPI003AF7E7AB